MTYIYKLGAGEVGVCCEAFGLSFERVVGKQRKQRVVADLCQKDVCASIYVCTYFAAPARARTRAHRLAAARQSSGVSQTPHPTACPQAGIPHRPP